MREVLVLVAVLGCHRAPPVAQADLAEPAEVSVPPELESLHWSTVAEPQGPLVEVVQTPLASDRCRVTAKVGARQAWSVNACLASRADLRFLSPDGTTLIVLSPAPEAESSDLSGTRIGTIYRLGVQLAALTPRALGFTSARAEGGHLRWLGERDQRAGADGVLLQTADGAMRTIRWDAEGLNASLAGPAAASSHAVQCVPCSYTDDQGTYHLADSLEDVPEQYRARARRPQGTINIADAVPPPRPDKEANANNRSQPEWPPWISAERYERAQRQAQAAAAAAAAAKQNPHPGCSVMQNDGTMRNCEDWEVRRWNQIQADSLRDRAQRGY